MTGFPLRHVWPGADDPKRTIRLDGAKTIRGKCSHVNLDFGDITNRWVLSYRTRIHTDPTTQMPPIVAVKNKYVKAPFPARTAIQVARLIPNTGITEIKVVARLHK
jgi:hypothetical protein